MLRWMTILAAFWMLHGVARAQDAGTDSVTAGETKVAVLNTPLLEALLPAGSVAVAL
jgi:hypothetical protein